MIIREISASLRALFVRLTAKTSTIAGTETVYLDDAGSSVKATLANVIRYGGGSPRTTTIGNATITQTTDGAMYLEVAGQTAGSARGVGAFDWQAIRNVAAMVGSGPYSLTVGQYNTVSGNAAGAFGTYHTASGASSFCLGNAAVSANSQQVAIGTAAGGPLGGNQINLQPMVAVTTDATLTALYTTQSATYRFVIPATRAIAFRGLVIAMCNVSSSSNFIKAWTIEGAITRDGNNTTRIVGTPTISMIAQDADGTPTPSAWAIASITADDTNEALAINVTGQAATTIRWHASLFMAQVGF